MPTNRERTKILLRKKISCRLLNLVNACNWDAATLRCNSHPQEAACITQGGDTVLHMACLTKPPPSFVRALVTASPNSARLQNHVGYTPLHVSSWVGDTLDVLQILIDAYPAAVSMQAIDGWIPLHFPCFRGDSAEVLRTLIKVDPTTVLIPDHNGTTPLAMLWNKFVIDNESKCILSGDIDSGRSEVRSGMEDIWEKILFMVKAAYNNSVDMPEGKKFRVVHALAGLKCPQSMLEFILSLHSDQLSEADEQGYLPIHVAITSREKSRKVDLRMLERLLQANPSAVTVADAKGRFPLNLAIENGMEWNRGLRIIFEAAPGMLEARDMKTRLYPFMLAATCEDIDINCVFELLRRCPSLVERGIMSKKNDFSSKASHQAIP